MGSRVVSKLRKTSRAGYLTFVADSALAVIATGKKMSIFA